MTTLLKIVVSVSCPTLLSHEFVTCFISYLPLLFLTSFLLSFLPLFLLSSLPFSHFPYLLHFLYPFFPISLAVRFSFFFSNPSFFLNTSTIWSLNLLYFFISQGELFTQMVHSSPVLTPCMFEYVYFARPDSVRQVHITYSEISF